jgi:hypothetical protein
MVPGGVKVPPEDRTHDTVSTVYRSIGNFRSFAKQNMKTCEKTQTHERSITP